MLLRKTPEVILWPLQTNAQMHTHTFSKASQLLGELGCGSVEVGRRHEESKHFKMEIEYIYLFREEAFML